MRMIAAVLMVFMSPIGLRLHSACRAGLVTSIIGRLAWAIPMAGLAALTLHDAHGLLLAPFLFAALTLPDFDSSDMGRVNGSRVGDGLLGAAVRPAQAHAGSPRRRQACAHAADGRDGAAVAA